MWGPFGCSADGRTTSSGSYVDNMNPTQPMSTAIESHLACVTIASSPGICIIQRTPDMSRCLFSKLNSRKTTMSRPLWQDMGVFREFEVWPKFIFEVIVPLQYRSQLYHDISRVCNSMIVKTSCESLWNYTLQVIPLPKVGWNERSFNEFWAALLEQNTLNTFSAT